MLLNTFCLMAKGHIYNSYRIYKLIMFFCWVTHEKITKEAINVCIYFILKLYFSIHALSENI